MVKNKLEQRTYEWQNKVLDVLLSFVCAFCSRKFSQQKYILGGIMVPEDFNTEGETTLKLAP